MKLRLLIAALFVFATIAFAADPIVIQGPEQAQLDLSLPDGGLPPVPGVQNIQVFRASRDKPDLADGKGWTYNHHVDMAVWNGRLYVAWSSGEKGRRRLALARSLQHFHRWRHMVVPGRTLSPGRLEPASHAFLSRAEPSPARDLRSPPR